VRLRFPPILIVGRFVIGGVSARFWDGVVAYPSALAIGAVAATGAVPRVLRPRIGLNPRFRFTLKKDGGGGRRFSANGFFCGGGSNMFISML